MAVAGPTGGLPDGGRITLAVEFGVDRDHAVAGRGVSVLRPSIPATWQWRYALLPFMVLRTAA
ncbi:hypothetical protein [Rhodococcus koreensis]